MDNDVYLTMACIRLKRLWFWHRWLRTGTFYRTLDNLEKAINTARVYLNYMETESTYRIHMINRIAHAREMLEYYQG